MAWCQAQAEVCYCLGLAKNARLTGLLAPALDRAREKQILCGGASVRDFAELSYRTLESPSAQSSGPRGWSRERRARPMHLPPLVPYAAASVIRARFEFHFTPKHGSPSASSGPQGWLNIAEIELSALARGCLARRIPDRATLARELHEWERDRNLTTRSIRWQSTTAAARTKLRKLYPSFED